MNFRFKKEHENTQAVIPAKAGIQVFKKNGFPITTSGMTTLFGGIISAFIMLTLFPPSSLAHASQREFDLFDKGYEYYLSYQPEKAAESFKTFLNEFPESSARDAALFWLGKSLIQMKSFEKASNAFAEMTRQYPDSPFAPYAVNEESGIFDKLSDAEKGRRENMKAKMADIEKRKEEDKVLRTPEQKRKKISGTPEGIRSETAAKAAEYETVEARIKGVAYTLPQIVDFMIHSTSVINKLGVKEVLWRGGNLYEDFVTETILYNQARRMNITGDRTKYKELVEKYDFTREETSYLDLYFAVCELIQKKIKGIPEKWSLAGKDAEGDKNEKISQFPAQAHDGEVSIVRTKGSHVLLRPIMSEHSFDPFADFSQERRAEIRFFIRSWVEKLKNGIKG